MCSNLQNVSVQKVSIADIRDVLWNMINATLQVMLSVPPPQAQTKNSECTSEQQNTAPQTHMPMGSRERRSVGERDTLDTQQHALLLDILVPAASRAVDGINGTNCRASVRKDFGF